MIIHFVIASMVYRYEHRVRLVRVLGAVAAVGACFLSSFGAVQVFTLWHRGLLPDVLPPGTVWMRLIGALIYGWLAFEVIRLARASNNRWSGP
jgi:hypothetical protein